MFNITFTISIKKNIPFVITYFAIKYKLFFNNLIISYNLTLCVGQHD